MTEKVLRLVTKEADQNVITLIEDILSIAKSGDVVSVVCCYATSDRWERCVSSGTPLLEAMGQLEVLKADLLREFLEANE